jgi:hypothetical protein
MFDRRAAPVASALSTTRAVVRHEMPAGALGEALDALEGEGLEAYLQRVWPVHAVVRTPSGRSEYICCAGRPL